MYLCMLVTTISEPPKQPTTDPIADPTAEPTIEPTAGLWPIPIPTGILFLEFNI